MTFPKLKILLLAALALMWSGVALSQPLDQAKLDLLLDRLNEKNKGMGALTLAKDGKVIYSHAFGYSYIKGDEKKPATAETKYRLASTTKTYTAVMVLQLVEEGKLKLSDTLDRFFPQIPYATKITIAHMLWHRSGIRNLEPDGSWGRQARTREEVLAKIAEGAPDFEPDTQSRYSNSGYNLLGQIIEKVGGKPYAVALKERIVAKLGLKETYALDVGQAEASRNEAVSYRYLDGYWVAPETDLSIPGGAGAILATTAEMAKFIQGIFDLKLISADSLKQMLTIKDGEGMGIVTFTFGGKTFYGHTGGGASSGTWLAYCPEEKLALAYATNLKIYPVVKIVEGALDIYWHRPYEVPTFEPLKLSPEVLDRYVGSYTHPDAPAKAEITRDGETLYFRPPGAKTAAPLEATEPDKFKIDPGVTFEFDTAKGQMAVKRRGVERVFMKEK